MTRLLDTEVGQAIDKLQFHHVNGSSIQRGERTYINFLSILAIGKEEEAHYLQLNTTFLQNAAQLNGNAETSIDTSQLALANTMEVYRFRLESIIRAIYEAASVTIGIISAEAQRNNDLYDLSLKKLVHSNPEMLAQLHMNTVRDAWIVTEYRNKIIAHHDYSRTFAFETTPNSCHMMPMGPGVFSELTNDDISKIERLWGIYKDDTNRPNEESLHEKRDLLFHSIPVLQDGRLSEDRKTIDKLVEQYGTKSSALPVIETAVRQFIIQLAAIM